MSFFILFYSRSDNAAHLYNNDFHLPSLLCSQVLGITEEPGGVSIELHEVYHQLALPSLPLHSGLRSAWHAAFWRTVRNTVFTFHL